MHSFVSAHNSVNWKIVVNGEAEQWPPFVRSFPLIVYPLRQQVQLRVPFHLAVAASVPHEVGA
jgi:hypothetical protein